MEKHDAHRPSLTPFLTGLWYVVAPARAVRHGHPIVRTMFSEPIVISRSRDGRVSALRDRCPHRGAPLSAGRQCTVDGRDAMQCPYHGWAFDIETGTCLAAPALSTHDRVQDVSGVKAHAYRVAERHGLIWLFYEGPAARQTPIGPAVGSPAVIANELQLKSLTIVDAHGPYEEAVSGLVDAAHTPFVHKQWWWRQGQAAREKQKYYEALNTGFRIPAHPPSGNSRIYRTLGGAPTTQIDVILPGIRIETIRNERHTIIGLTAITPLSANRNRLFHALYWTLPLMTALTPIIDAMAKSFLAQDAAILNAQATRLSEDERPAPLFLGDPDEPSKWMRQLARAWRAHQERGTDTESFENPVNVRDLHWKT
ncbi:MAG: aromatic ring-hydroxylating dioxygenase subunit alpha [Pseudomonadota bacterium]